MSKHTRISLTIAGCAVAALLLSRLFAQTSLSAVASAAAHAGPLVLTAVIPFAFGMAFDALGIVVLLRALGHRLTLAQVLPVRLASEALHITMPAGFLASDAAHAVLLESHCSVPGRDGVVASIARKWLVMRSHAVYIALGVVFGFAALAKLSGCLLGHAGLPWVVALSAAVPLGMSAAIGAGLLGRSTFSRLHSALSRLPFRRLSRWVESRRHEAVATDAQVGRLRAARGATSLAAAAFLGCWCFESLESALLLRLVGADVELAAVFAIEAGLSLVRSAAILAPSGLGVVNLGYATVLPVLGADAGMAPAFVLLKRAKELVWVAIGYAILGVLRAQGLQVGRPMAGVVTFPPAHGPLAERQTQRTSNPRPSRASGFDPRRGHDGAARPRRPCGVREPDGAPASRDRGCSRPDRGRDAFVHPGDVRRLLR